ncbi:hypothetical protein GCM10027270_10620 [Nocardioides ginkgobilobae]
MHSRSGSSPQRRRAAAIGVGLAVAATSASVVALAPAAQAADPVTITLLNINDFHGRIDANTTKFATTVEQLRADRGEANTLFLSAGDNIGASLFASSVQDDQPTIDVLNALELAASAVGNHEFDGGFADLEDRVVPASDFEILGANVYEKGTTTPALDEFEVYEVAGVSVGVIGAVTQETPSLVSPGGIADLEFGDPVEAVNRVAAQLSDGDPGNGEAEVIVAEYHEGAGAGTPDGSTPEEEVAAGGAFADIALQTAPEVDVIFTGHTHKEYAWEIEGRPVVQTGSYGANVGVVDLTVDPDTGEVSAAEGSNVARAAAEDLSLPRVAEVKEITDAALAFAAEVGNRPVSEITADITTAFAGGSYVDGRYVAGEAGTRDDRSRESTLGGLVANALRDGVSDFAEPDLGITNPGGLRAELLFAGDTSSNPANTDGVVTFAEANGVLPFNNTVAIVEMTGAQIEAVLEQQWQTQADGTVSSRPYLQLGLSDNVRVTADPTAPAGERITSVRIDDEPLDPAATYTVSTLTFLAQGGDNFRAFTDAEFVDTGLLDAQMWRDYLADNAPLSPDFGRQQVFESGFDPSVTAGEEVAFTLGAGETTAPVVPINAKTLDLTSLGSPQNSTVSVYLRQGEEQVDIGEFPVADGIAEVAFTAPSSLTGTWDVGVVAEPSGTVVGAAPLPEAEAVVTAKRNPKGPLKAGTKKLKVTIKVRLDGEPASGEVLLRGEDVRKRVELDEKGRAVTRIGPFEDKGTQVVTVSYGDASDTLRFKVR